MMTIAPDYRSYATESTGVIFDSGLKVLTGELRFGKC